MFPAELLTICSLVARAGGSEDQQVQAMADRMVEYALQCMKNRNRVSPFERTFFSSIISFLFIFTGFFIFHFCRGSFETRHVFPRRSKFFPLTETFDVSQG